MSMQVMWCTVNRDKKIKKKCHNSNTARSNIRHERCNCDNISSMQSINTF